MYFLLCSSVCLLLIVYWLCEHMYMKATESLIPCPTCNIPLPALFFRAGYMLNLKWCLSSSFQLYKAALLPFQLSLELPCLWARALSAQFPSSASHPRPPVTLQRSGRLDTASPGLSSSDVWVHPWLAPCPRLGQHRIVSALQHEVCWTRKARLWNGSAGGFLERYISAAQVLGLSPSKLYFSAWNRAGIDSDTDKAEGKL